MSRQSCWLSSAAETMERASSPFAATSMSFASASDTALCGAGQSRSAPSFGAPRRKCSANCLMWQTSSRASSIVLIAAGPGDSLLLILCGKHPVAERDRKLKDQFVQTACAFFTDIIIVSCLTSNDATQCNVSVKVLYIWRMLAGFDRHSDRPWKFKGAWHLEALVCGPRLFKFN